MLIKEDGSKCSLLFDLILFLFKLNVSRIKSNKRERNFNYIKVFSVRSFQGY